MEIVEYLEENKINIDNFNRLIYQFRDNEFIPFIGAGISVPTGEPDWKDLLKKMQNSTGIKIKIVKDANGLINYPRCFSNIYKKMENKLAFYSHLFDQIKPTETRYTACHREIVETFNSYVTTNYDSTLEQIFEKDKNQKMKRFFFSCYETDKLNNCIVYLHGHRDINFAILKEEDYDYFYPTISKKNGIPILEAFIEKVYEDKILLFIGFSFSDKYIYDFFQYLASKVKERKHFALINNTSNIYSEVRRRCEEFRRLNMRKRALKEEDKFFEKLMSINIYPIVYHQNIFIEKLLESLNKEKILPDLRRKEITGEV